MSPIVRMLTAIRGALLRQRFIVVLINAFTVTNFDFYLGPSEAARMP